MKLLAKIIFICLCWPLILSAQETSDSGEISWMHAVKKMPYEKIEGSPYYFEWGKGDIILKNGTVYKNVNINYDIYQAQMHVKNDTQGLIAIHSELIQEAIIRNGSQTYRFKPFLSEKVKLFSKDGGDVYTRFYEVIYEGKKYAYYKLSLKFFVEAEPMGPGKAYDVSKIEGAFTQKQRYYLRDALGNFQFLPPRKKTFLSAFSAHGGLLKDYIKTKKPNFNKHRDIHDMMKFLEENIDN